jgi:hypothetical protein
MKSIQIFLLFITENTGNVRNIWSYNVCVWYLYLHLHLHLHIHLQWRLRH